MLHTVHSLCVRGAHAFQYALNMRAGRENTPVSCNLITFASIFRAPNEHRERARQLATLVCYIDVRLTRSVQLLVLCSTSVH